MGDSGDGSRGKTGETEQGMSQIPRCELDLRDEQEGNHEVTSRLQAYVTGMGMSLRMVIGTCLKYISLKGTFRHLIATLQMGDCRRKER